MELIGDDAHEVDGELCHGFPESPTDLEDAAMEFVDDAGVTPSRPGYTDLHVRTECWLRLKEARKGRERRYPRIGETDDHPRRGASS